jgi:hypothetical protein
MDNSQAENPTRGTATRRDPGDDPNQGVETILIAAVHGRLHDPEKAGIPHLRNRFSRHLPISLGPLCEPADQRAGLFRTTYKLIDAWWGHGGA